MEKQCAICGAIPAPLYSTLPDGGRDAAGHICHRCFATLETAKQTEEDDPSGQTDAWKVAHQAVIRLMVDNDFIDD